MEIIRQSRGGDAEPDYRGGRKMILQKAFRDYKRQAVLIAVFAVFAVIALSAAFLTQKPKLTMQKVRELSRKGESLSWEDFAPYAGGEIGSGLYIMQYDINGEYTVLVGGGSPKEKPFYIRLVNKISKEDIDIRKENIDLFLSHNNTASKQ